MREQRLLTEVIGQLGKLLPFALLGLDTDDDSVFMNEPVRDYCLAADVEFTRCRPLPQKRPSLGRAEERVQCAPDVGYRRFEGGRAATRLVRLYAAPGCS